MWNTGKESGWYQGILFNFWANCDLSIQENKGCRRKNRFLGGGLGEFELSGLSKER